MSEENELQSLRNNVMCNSKSERKLDNWKKRAAKKLIEAIRKFLLT